jgi:prepilin-type processing-associated H-X9-DG protein
LFGERPPSPLNDYGWWYAGVGTGDGALDHTLGLAETHLNQYGNCRQQASKFQVGNIREECDAAHFWSLHGGGAHFARADGSVAFYSYSGADILAPLSTRDEGVTVPRD